MKSEELSNRDKQLDQLLEAVLKSSKYRNVCEDLIKDIGMRELSSQQNLKTAIKSTKNKLHQIGGAYFLQRPNYGLWLEKLRNAQKSRDGDLFRRTCAEIMSYHYSTRERLKIIDQFYTRIFSLLPPIHSIMDVACGFHPLSIPWMPLPSKVKYYAYDVYKDLISFLNDFMVIANVDGCAETCDVVHNTPKVKADLAFILSTLPCLEQIEKSASLRILELVNANFLVVSFPVQSLGGREKNMRRHYTTRFNELTQVKDWGVRQLEFRTESVFLITKNL
jgi:16S rRNA (guanine(1405)-N(7))-methyltransferase